MMTALNRKLARDLWRMRGQVLTVALVAACGIATYVTMTGAYLSLGRAQQDYYERYRFADVFAQLKRAPDSLAASIAAIPGVNSVETRVVEDVALDVPGLEEPAVGRLVSVPENRAPRLNDVSLQSGRTIEPGSRDEVLVSEAFASANHLKIGDTVGAVINGRWQRLHIVGFALSPEYVYEILGTQLFPDNKRFGVFWMSRSALGPAFMMDGAFNDVSLSLSPGASEAEVISRLDALLEPYGGLGSYGRKDQISNRFVSDEISQDRVTGVFVPAIFLTVAAFLVHVVLSRLVHAQRGAIGLLKAFGYGNASIATHYLKFALAAVSLGGLMGIPLGLWLGSGLVSLYRDFFRFPNLHFYFSWPLVISATLISAAAACLGALSALRSVIALPPAQAMLPEAPARFRPGIAERMGLARVIPLSARMIFRNMERRPWKALLSTIGLSLACAILIVGFSFYDAIDYLMRVEFEAAFRESVAVTLSEPHDSSAAYALSQLPGVLRAERFRVVPAKLRFEHSSYRVAILGLEPYCQLHRLVDARFRTIEIPPEGLVLSSSLAQILGVSVGQQITVEVLEGERPVRRAVVARTIDDLIGTSAYMDINALNRLMHEGGTISGAYLSVDAKSAPRLYSFLKHTPAVGGVSVRAAMLQSFQQTIARSLDISTGALVAFACVIAFGVVYNSARIALSERAHELASLRVLGFTQGEINWMLLGEQGILTAISIPLGFFLGYWICALLVRAMESELYRMPLVITRHTYGLAFLVVAACAVASSGLVIGHLRRLDLVAVLKARE